MIRDFIQKIVAILAAILDFPKWRWNYETVRKIIIIILDFRQTSGLC